MKNAVYKVWLSAVLILLISGCNKDKPADPSLSMELEQMLQTHFASYAQYFPNKAAGVFVAVKSADREEFAAYGFDGVMTANTHFKGASTTKTFTASAILLLQEQGKLHIDDVISDNIPGTNTPYIPDNSIYNIPFKNDITIRQLLGHRAGVFDVTNTVIPDTVATLYAGMIYPEYLKGVKGETFTFSFDSLVAPVSRHQLFYFQPGTSMRYSNTGYNLLGKIVERISGMTLADYKKQHFLDPLGMTRTRFQDDGTEIILPQPYVDSYLRFGTELIDFTQDNLSSAASEGNIVTTPKDLANWAFQLYSTTDVLSSASLSEMMAPIPTGEHHVLYGLGCQSYPEDIGVGHNGIRVAFMIVMRYHPETQAAYVVATNTLYLDDLFLEDAMLVNILRDAIDLISEN